LGHASYRGLERMMTQGMVQGVGISADDFRREAKHEGMQPCPACIMGKAVRQPFSSSDGEVAKVPGGKVVSDVQGPIDPPSLGGARYGLFTKDMYSGITLFTPLVAKSEVVERVQEHILRMETASGHQVKHFQCDTGTEYLPLTPWLDAKGITHFLTCRYTPEQNGGAERQNRTVAERFRAMLAESGVPKECWAEGFNYVVWLTNRTPREGQQATPYELFFGH
jgi:hypothetical protein